MNLMMIFVINYHPRTHVFDLINGKCSSTRYFCVSNRSICSPSYLESGQVELAEKEKGRLEEAQRSRSSSAVSPKWFVANGDSYELIREEDSSHSYWKKREEHWARVDFVPLW